MPTCAVGNDLVVTLRAATTLIDRATMAVSAFGVVESIAVTVNDLVPARWVSR